MRIDQDSRGQGPAPNGDFLRFVDEASGFHASDISRLHHDLHRHPLFEMAQLEQLAHELAPLGKCRFVRPSLTQASSFAHTDQHPQGFDIDEVFRRIEEPRSWIALYNIELVARYRALVSEILDAVRPLVELEQGRIFLEAGFVFISAPPSVTPFHIDRENNFWLQLHGRKTINIWRPDDRMAVSEEAIEDFIVAQSSRDVRLKEELRARSHAFDVGPGEGVYFPSTAAHMTRSDVDWCQPGDAVAVSVGVTFYTEATRRAARVHQVNRLLRKQFKMSPRAPGVSPALDYLKAPLGCVIGATRQLGLRVIDPLLHHQPAPARAPGSY